MRNFSSTFLLLACISAFFLIQPANAALYVEDNNASLLKAEKLYGKKDYEGALNLCLDVLKTDPENDKANYLAGKCFLESPYKEKSLDYLTNAYKKNPQVAGDINYLMGKAYHLNGKYDDAVTCYNRSLKQDQVDNSEDAKRRIKQCNTAKQLSGRPSKLKVERLGSNINSPYPDYAPVVTGNDSLMFFTSRRKGTTRGFVDDENGNQYYEDIYFSEFKNGEWSAAKNTGKPINSGDHDATISISYDGKKLFIYKGEKKGTIYESNYDDAKKEWSKPQPIKGKVNSPDYENHASLSKDGKTLYLALERSDSYGGTDIYASKLGEDGTWGAPVNLGKSVNTEFDEDGPAIAYDGKTLYFSSKGHDGMGGFDIFKTVSGDGGKTWSKPENMGVPLNSPDDDVHISLTEQKDGKMYGYFASTRPGGAGDKDIYRIGLPPPEPQGLKDVLFTIYVKDCETGEYTDAKVKVSKGQSTIAQKANPQMGVYQYTFENPENMTYEVYIEKRGYSPSTRQVTIPKRTTEAQKITDTVIVCLDKLAEENVKNIYFDYDKADLRPASIEQLDILINIMKKNPSAQVWVYGYADARGTDQYNLKLSERRSKAAVKYMVSKGMDPKKFLMKGFGESDPAASNDTEENMQLNRRVEFNVIKNP